MKNLNKSENSKYKKLKAKVKEHIAKEHSKSLSSVKNKFGSTLKHCQSNYALKFNPKFFLIHKSVNLKEINQYKALFVTSLTVRRKIRDFWERVRGK